MDQDLIKSTIASLVRHALTGLAAYLVARGLITGEQAEAWILAAASGAIGLAWALWNKYKVSEKIKLALKLNPDTNTITDLNNVVAAGVSSKAAASVVNRKAEQERVK